MVQKSLKIPLRNIKMAPYIDTSKVSIWLIIKVVELTKNSTVICKILTKDVKKHPLFQNFQTTVEKSSRILQGFQNQTIYFIKQFKNFLNHQMIKHSIEIICKPMTNLCGILKFRFYLLSVTHFVSKLKNG